jgi:hypothetical protein
MAAPALPVVALQEWAGLQHAAPAIQQGMCNAVRRLSGEAATAITLDGTIIAKVGGRLYEMQGWSVQQQKQQQQCRQRCVRQCSAEALRGSSNCDYLGWYHHSQGRWEDI